MTEDEQEALRPLRTGRKEEILGRPNHGGKASFPTFSVSLSHNLVAF